MKTTRSIVATILGLLMTVILINCGTDRNKQRLTASDTTAILQTVFDFSNADFDTVAAISKKRRGDTISIFRNTIITKNYQLNYKGKSICYAKSIPPDSEVSVFRPKMALDFWIFKKLKNSDTLQVQFGIRDWGLICDYHLVKKNEKWQVVALGNSEGKW